MDPIVCLLQIHNQVPHHGGYGDGFDFEDRGPKLSHGIFNEKFTGEQGFPVDLNRAGSALGMLA